MHKYIQPLSINTPSMITCREELAWESSLAQLMSLAQYTGTASRDVPVHPLGPHERKTRLLGSHPQCPLAKQPNRHQLHNTLAEIQSNGQAAPAPAWKLTSEYFLLELHLLRLAQGMHAWDTSIDLDKAYLTTVTSHVWVLSLFLFPLPTAIKCSHTKMHVC
jgi:hypothetical protein